MLFCNSNFWWENRPLWSISWVFELILSKHSPYKNWIQYITVLFFDGTTSHITNNWHHIKRFICGSPLKFMCMGVKLAYSTKKYGKLKFRWNMVSVFSQKEFGVNRTPIFLVNEDNSFLKRPIAFANEYFWEIKFFKAHFLVFSWYQANFYLIKNWTALSQRFGFRNFSIKVYDSLQQLKRFIYGPLFTFTSKRVQLKNGAKEIWKMEKSIEHGISSLQQN